MNIVDGYSDWIKLRDNNQVKYINISGFKPSSILPSDVDKAKAWVIEHASEDMFTEPPKILFIDLETDFRGEHYDSNELMLRSGRIISGAYYDLGTKKFSYLSGPEREIITHIFKEKPDALVGWNLINFDVPVLIRRAARYGIKPPWMVPFDYARELKAQLGKQFSSNKLEDVAQTLLGEGKIKHEGFPSDLPPDLLKQYNLRDVELLVKLESQYSIIAAELQLQKIAMCSLKAVQLRSEYLDVMVLREALKRGIRLPRNNWEAKKETYPGGYVYAKPGLYKDCISLDVNSLYPAIMIAYNMGIDSLDREGELKAANGLSFKRHPPSIYASIEKSLWKVRDDLKNSLKICDAGDRVGLSVKERAVKIALNALYGLNGASFYRAYDPQLASSVTLTGQEIIKKIEVFIRHLGRTVALVDTDGIMFTSDGHVPELLKNKVNDMLAKEYQSLNWPFEVKIDKRCQAVLVLKKKKYCWLEGGEINFVGIDRIRSDTSAFAGKGMEKLAGQLLTGVPARTAGRTLFNEVGKTISQAPLKEIAVPKGMVKDLDQYVNQSAWVRGAKFSNELFGTDLGKGDKPKLLYGYYPRPGLDDLAKKFGPGPFDVLCYEDERSVDWSKFRVDYPRMLSQTVYPKLHQLVEPWMTYKDFVNVNNQTLDRWVK